MAGIGTWLKGAVAQLNPFDGGKNFRSVQDEERKRQEAEARRREQQRQQVRQSLGAGNTNLPAPGVVRPQVNRPSVSNPIKLNQPQAPKFTQPEAPKWQQPDTPKFIRDQTPAQQQKTRETLQRGVVQKRQAEANAKQQHVNKLNEMVQSRQDPAKQVAMRDYQITDGRLKGRSISDITNLYNRNQGMGQTNILRDIEADLKGLEEDYSDQAAFRKYQLQLAQQELQRNGKKQATLGSTLNTIGKALLVDPFTNTGEGVAKAVYTATGERERRAKDFDRQAEQHYQTAMNLLNRGDKQAAQHFFDQYNEQNRMAGRVRETQVEESDPVLNAGRVSSAAAMPFAFAAQGASAGRAAVAGARNTATSQAARTRIGALVENVSPQIRGELAKTTAGNVLNSTPAQLVNKTLPTASTRLQAVASESVANVLSGVPLSPAMTAQQLGSSGRLEGYLIEATTGAVIDAAFPVATYGAGRAVGAFNDHLKNMPLTQPGFVAGPLAGDFRGALARGEVFEGVDGKPRFEVDDSQMKIKNPNGRTLGELIDHSELFKNYPHLKNIKVDSSLRGGAGGDGSYSSRTNTIQLNPNLSPEKLRSTILHELQHGIQNKEGFSAGSSPANFIKKLSSSEDAELFNLYKKQEEVGLSRAEQARLDDLNGIDPLEGYYRSAGEAEARAVEARMDMPMSERYVAPDPVVNQKTGETLSQSVKKLEGYGWSKADIEKYKKSVLGGNSKMEAPKGSLDSLNPTGGLYADYTPAQRAKAPLADNMTTLDKTLGGKPDDIVTIYRGAPKNQKEIVAGDFVTLDKQAAQSYAGEGHVIAKQVRKGDLLDELDSPSKGDETIYRPNADKESRVARKTVATQEAPKPRSTFYDSLDVPKEDLIVRTEPGKALALSQIRNHPEMLQLDETLDLRRQQIQELKDMGRADGYSQIVQLNKSIDDIIRQQDQLANRLSKQGMAMSIDMDKTLPYRKMTKEMKREVDDIIYQRNPELFYTDRSDRVISESGSNDIPRMHVEDLKEFGYESEIPSRYKRMTGPRNIDELAGFAGYEGSDASDRFLASIKQELDARFDALDNKRALVEARQDPEILAEATKRVNDRVSENTAARDELLADRKNALLDGDAKLVAEIDDVIRGIEKAGKLDKVKLAKVRNIEVKGPRSKMTEYVAVNSIDDAGKGSFEMIPLDGKKHTLKNGVVVDKDGKNVGSYVGIDENGQQYAYLEGKPVNITGILGDIDAWGNMNKSTWDMDRLIEANAPNKETARRVQQFTTVFKDQQEAAMKTELVQRRKSSYAEEQELIKNLPAGVSKKQLSEDMFSVMEKKVSLDEILERYGKSYVAKYMKPAIQRARKEQDEILKEVNGALVRNGFDEIPRRENYITHIQKDPTFWEKVGIGIQDITHLGSSINSDINPGKVRGAVPEEIVGNTSNTSARRRWNPFAQKREGSDHDMDFFKARDSYYEPMLFNKYMTPAASRSRIVERTFRTFEKAKQIKAEEALEIAGSASEARDLAGLNKPRNHSKYKASRTSPFVLAWQEYGNRLAGKTNKWDRMVMESGEGMEKALNASIRLQGIAGANTIPGSATAALAQTLSIPQTVARDSMRSFLTGLKDTVQFTAGSKVGADGRLDPMRQSAFMRARYTDATSRRKGAVRKYTSAASKPMEAIERFTGEISWRSAYAEAKANGLSGAKAIREADIQTKQTLAGRGIGDRPLAMDSKALGILTQFGLEVNNMRIQVWNDFTPYQKTKFILSAYALNEAYSWLTGQDPLPDYISAAIDTYQDFATDEKNDDGTSKRSTGDKTLRGSQRLLEETAKFVPGAGPMANAIPKDMREWFFGRDSDVSRFGTMAATRAPMAAWQALTSVLEGDVAGVGDAALQVAPTGQQARRSIGGISTMSEGVNRTRSGNINTSVDNSNPLKWLQAGLFGKNALHEVQGVYDNNAFATTESQTDIYERIKANAGQQMADAYLQSIKGVGGDEGKKATLDASAEAAKQDALAQQKIEKGEWREENGLLVNKNGDVQRKHYKTLATARNDESDETYELYMKGYNIDGASNRKHQAELSGNKTLDKLRSQEEKYNKATTAMSMYTSKEYADMPAWVKERYFKKAGYTKEDVEYGVMAGFSTKEKVDAVFRPYAKENDKGKLIDYLIEGRRESISGKMFAYDTVVDQLRREGYLTSAEAKAIKNIKLDSKGKTKSSSGGSGRRGGSGRKRSGSGKASSQVSFKAALDALEATMATRVPTTSAAPGSGSLNTKRTLQKAQLRKWSAGSGASSGSKPKITVRKGRSY